MAKEFFFYLFQISLWQLFYSHSDQKSTNLVLGPDSTIVEIDKTYTIFGNPIMYSYKIPEIHFLYGYSLVGFADKLQPKNNTRWANRENRSRV